jgi:hypothetical protein
LPAQEARGAERVYRRRQDGASALDEEDEALDPLRELAGRPERCLVCPLAEDADGELDAGEKAAGRRRAAGRVPPLNFGGPKTSLERGGADTAQG